MAKDYMKKLFALDGAVKGDYNPFGHIIQTPSPSTNFLFGNTHGLPLGYTAILYGPPGGGKSLVSSMTSGQVHRDYEDGIVVKFDTEFREASQMSEKSAALFGIDPERYICYSVNRPSEVFDRIEKDLAALCDDGAPIKLVIIDSITGVQGRREENADSVDVQQVGDQALTIQTGLRRILPIQRRHKFAVLLTAHVRAEMDQLEQRRGGTMKMAAGWGLKHFAEYFVMIEQNKSKEGKEDLLGNPFRNKELGDVRTGGDGEITAVKIRTQMKKSFVGPVGRTGEFTFDFARGIINTHEEVFLLGTHRGLIARSGSVYSYGDRNWNGKKTCLDDLRKDTDLCKVILQDLKRRDLAGEWRNEEQSNTPST